MKPVSERVTLIVVFLLFIGMSARLFSGSPDDKVFRPRPPNVEPVMNSLYTQECSDCHLAYSRSLLPERSWRQLLKPGSLNDHFGEYLVIEEPQRQEIEEYLAAGAVEKAGNYYISRKIKASLRDTETPLRISRLRYIWSKHRDIPEKYISANSKVISLSQCSACHQRVDQGIFDEDEVYIPYRSKDSKKVR